MGKRSRLLKARRDAPPPPPQERPLRAAEPTLGGPPQRARPTPLPPLESLKRRRWTIEAQERRTGAMVYAARAAGHSWREIGAALGMTGEGARRHWGP